MHAPKTVTGSPSKPTVQYWPKISFMHVPADVRSTIQWSNSDCTVNPTRHENLWRVWSAGWLVVESKAIRLGDGEEPLYVAFEPTAKTEIEDLPRHMSFGLITSSRQIGNQSSDWKTKHEHQQSTLHSSQSNNPWSTRLARKLYHEPHHLSKDRSINETLYNSNCECEERITICGSTAVSWLQLAISISKRIHNWHWTQYSTKSTEAAPTGELVLSETVIIYYKY